MTEDRLIPADLDPFPVVIALPVQWGDQDAFGHVNNTVPLRWFELSETGRGVFRTRHAKSWEYCRRTTNPAEILREGKVAAAGSRGRPLRGTAEP